MSEWEASIVFEKNLEAIKSGKYRYIINEGGSRSTKTWSLIQLFIVLANQEPSRFTIWRAKRTWTKSTVYDDFIKYLKLTGIYQEDRENKSNLIYKEWESTIEFGGLDDYQKLHGLTQDYAWLNEGIEASKKDFDQIDMRTRKAIFIDYNPSTDEHWIYDLARQEKSILIRSTIFDNPFIEQAVIDKIRSFEPSPENIARGTADSYSWNVYGLGQRARKEGQIFNYELIPEWNPDATVLGNSLDFGFHPDPTASARVGMLNGRLIIDELFYEHKLNYTNTGANKNSIEQRLIESGVSKRDLIVADSAQSQGISQFQSMGYYIKKSQKYSGSVLDGIRLLEQHAPFYVTERSLNVIKELDNYTWQIDAKTGKATNEPIDNWNHIIDGVRYVAMEKLKYVRTGRRGKSRLITV